MHDKFDDFSDDVSYSTDAYEFQDCFDCPYFFRQFPTQPPHMGTPHGGPQSGPPFTGSPQGGQPGGGPPGPPPLITPAKTHAQAGTQAVSPSSIRHCTYKYVYIWLTNGRSFWAWLTRVDKRSASGFRWNHNRWVYFGVDLKSIDYFECY